MACDDLLASAAVAAQQAAQDAEPGLGCVGLRRLVRPVPQGHVGDLVREHARQLALGARGLEQAAVHVQEAAREREGVDVGRVHDPDLVGVARARAPRSASRRTTGFR